MQDSGIVSPSGTPDSPLANLPSSAQLLRNSPDALLSVTADSPLSAVPSSPVSTRSSSPLSPLPDRYGSEDTSSPHPLKAPSLESLADIVPLPPVFDIQSEADSSDCEGGSGYATTDAGDATDYDVDPAAIPQLNAAQKRKRESIAKRNAGKKLHRQTKRQRLAAERMPTTLRAPTFREAPLAVHTALSSESDFPVNSTGFLALRTKSLKPGEVWTLGELQGMGLLKWDGK